MAGGKSGLLQGGWLLTGAVRKGWKVPQKLYHPLKYKVGKGEMVR